MTNNVFKVYVGQTISCYNIFQLFFFQNLDNCVRMDNLINLYEKSQKWIN